MVDSITYLSTYLRRSDGSIIVIPNSVFSNVQLINWSRMPYQIFKPMTSLPATQIAQLGDFLASLRDALSAIPEIETKSRDLIIAATSFKDGKINVEMEMHMQTSDDPHAAELKTKVIQIIVDKTALFSAPRPQ